MLVQRSFFPDAHEVHAHAFAALEELDLAAAHRLVEKARADDPLLANLEPLREALSWLLRESGPEPVSDELLALLFASVPAARAAGELTPAAAAMVDQALARQGLRRPGASAEFLDPERSLHRGALLLVLGRAREALPLLRESLARLGHRADLWAAYGDACHALERHDEANSAYVRSLLLGATEVDLFRLRHPDLCALRDELVPLHGEACARELLLVHAWLAGTLAIPAENAWLEPHLSRLHLAATLPATPLESHRLRRFALLFYVDRSRPPGHYDEHEREELQSLHPELFARVMQRAAELEKRLGRSLRW